jgi:hypothetical protein
LTHFPTSCRQEPDRRIAFEIADFQAFSKGVWR